MEGALESTVRHQTEQEQDQEMAKTMTNAIIEQWEVQYARFICSPIFSSLTAPASTHHPSLTPHSAATRKRRRGGVWISTPSATVKFIPDRSTGTDDTVLIVTLCGKLVVSCISGFPARGARAVILSYKDCEGQVQKFSLRFLTIQETEKFIHVVKEAMEGSEDPRDESNSGPSSQSEFAPYGVLPYRDNEDCRQSDSADISTHQMTSNSKAADQSIALVNISHCEGDEFISNFPPSFSSFLMNCYPAAGKANPRTTQEINLKSEFAKYMEDSSFQDLFIKVEKAVSELGDDIIF